MLSKDATVIDGQVRQKTCDKDASLCVNLSNKGKCLSGANGVDDKGWRKNVKAGDPCPFLGQSNFKCNNYKV